MWGGCGLHPNDMSFFFLFFIFLMSVCVCERERATGPWGEECYHWSVSHPDPPLLSLHFMWRVCVCEGGAFMLNGDALNASKEAMIVCMIYYSVHVYHGGWREHPCVMWACKVDKAEVSHPQASIACYHGSRTAGTPPLHVFFFFTHLSSLSSSSSISSSSFSSLTHRWLPTTATDDIITPSQTLCCGESYCTSRFSPLGSSASQQDRPKCYPFIHKILLKSLKRSSLDGWLLMFVAWVTSSILTFIL